MTATNLPYGVSTAQSCLAQGMTGLGPIVTMSG